MFSKAIISLALAASALANVFVRHYQFNHEYCIDTIVFKDHLPCGIYHFRSWSAGDHQLAG
jgi:hypothetical protein